MAKEIKVSFMVEEEMAEHISKVAFDLDRNKSEVIRAALLIGLPAVKDIPRLCHTIQFTDRGAKNQ